MLSHNVSCHIMPDPGWVRSAAPRDQRVQSHARSEEEPFRHWQSQGAGSCFACAPGCPHYWSLQVTKGACICSPLAASGPWGLHWAQATRGNAPQPVLGPARATLPVPASTRRSTMKDAEQIALPLQEVMDTMTSGGTFEEMENADDDSGLPFVYGKLKRALALAVAASSQSPGPAPPSHRLQ